MRLTDIDNIVFEIPQGSLKKIRERKAYREIITKMGDHFKVKESVNDIMYMASKEGSKENE